MNVPILNIYYMLVYAWDALDEAEHLCLRAEDSTQLVDLFAHVLHSGVEAILRRGLDRGYVSHHEVIPAIRGKLDLSASIKAGTLRYGRAACEFDELTHDVQHNRILKSTIRKLLDVSDLSPELRDRLADTHYRLHQIPELELSDRAFRSVQLYRSSRHYRLLMSVCRLLHQARLTSEEVGESDFRDFLRDERQMRALFERFVRNFYKKEQHLFQVSRTRMPWTSAIATVNQLALLPMMETDITLVSDERLIVVETKFVAEALVEHRAKRTLRSGHLYQLLAYVKSIAAMKLAVDKEVSAILLYPTVSTRLDLRYELHGFPLRVFTLDLNRHWSEIRGDLVALLDRHPAGD